MAPANNKKKVSPKALKALRAWRQAVEHVGRNYSRGEFTLVPKKGTKQYREAKKVFERIMKGSRSGNSTGKSGH